MVAEADRLCVPVARGSLANVENLALAGFSTLGYCFAVVDKATKMKTFEFSIVISGLDPEADDFADRFFEAGCDDATISVQKGHIIADFAREGVSIERAMLSALDCVAAAGGRVDRVQLRQP